MPHALAPEFDPERLFRRQGFLLDRAATHDAYEGDQRLWHHACAATLRRDAAAIAVLRGDTVAPAPGDGALCQRSARLPSCALPYLWRSGERGTPSDPW
jgi:hypothetical protein